jgi:hypothetical protein
MEPPRTHAYAVGQRVRSLSSYHRGEVGIVIPCQELTSMPAYLVEFAGGARVFLWDVELEPPGTPEPTP